MNSFINEAYEVLHLTSFQNNAIGVLKEDNQGIPKDY